MMLSLFDAIADPVLVFDREWRFEYVNASAHALLGRSTDELRDVLLWEEHPRLLGTEFETEARRVMEHGGRAEIREMPTTRGFWARAVVSQLGSGVCVHLRDVTAERRAMNELAEQAKRHRQLMEQSKDGIYIFDRQGRITEVNPRACEMLGYTRDELVGLTLADLLVPSELDRTPVRWEMLDAGEELRTERVMRRRDGLAVLTEIASRRIGEGLYQGIARDETERVEAVAALFESELRFKTAFDTSAVGMALTAADGRLLQVNPAFARLLGYEQEEYHALSWQSLTHPDDVEPNAVQVRRLLAGESDWFQMEKRYVRRDGQLVHTLLSSAAVRDARGEMVYMVTQVQDITERTQLESQLRQAQKMEAVGQLAGGVAHDFNNLLTVISCHCDLLLQDLGDNEQASSQYADDVQEIKKAASRATGLTRQLLAFSRKQLLQPRVLDLNDVVRELDPMLRLLLGTDIRIESVLEPEGAFVLADPGQLERVLVNLAVNARDAMPDGGTLHIITDLYEPTESMPVGQGTPGHGAHVRLTVRDTGDGMSPETAARVFEPFFTTKEQGKGTGLGLSTVYGIVKQSGGHITFESAPGMGTTFVIHLPASDGRSELAVESGESAWNGGAETILLVEDEEGVRRLARRILEQQGYTVLEATSGPEAIAIAETHPERIHLVLTDMMMPGMNGRALVEEIVRRRPDVRAVYMSGYTDDDIVRRGLDDPQTAFLQKPFSAAALALLLREVLDDEVAGRPMGVPTR